jgi:hypothetical protein
LKGHRNWIICESYTPNGVVVVVDVVTAKVTTVVVVVNKEEVMFLWFIILPKNTIFYLLKKLEGYFCEYHNFSSRKFSNFIF